MIRLPWPLPTIVARCPKQLGRSAEAVGGMAIRRSIAAPKSRDQPADRKLLPRSVPDQSPRPLTPRSVASQRTSRGDGPLWPCLYIPDSW